MAKWIYERWSFKWDESRISSSVSTVTIYSSENLYYVYRPNAEPSLVMFRDMKLNDIYITERNKGAWDAGESIQVLNLITREMYTRYDTSQQRMTYKIDYSRVLSASNITKNNIYAELALKDSHIDNIVLEEGSVPDDGVHTDGYWYVKTKAVSGFVLKDGIWKPIGLHLPGDAVYERWKVGWDISDLAGQALSEPYPYVIDPFTLQPYAKTPEVGDACLYNQTHVNWFNNGQTVPIRFVIGWEGNKPISLRGDMTATELAHRRIKDTRLSDIVLEEGTVPDDGIHTDGYWYVKTKAVSGDAVMTRWVYERWNLKWDDAAFTTSSTTNTLYSNTINMVTLEVEKRPPSIGEAALYSSSDVADYESGKSATVRLLQSQGTRYQYKTATYRRLQLSDLRIKGDRMPDIILEEGSVPRDGIHTDGYWYVKTKGESGYVLKDGVWKPIEDIFVLKDGQWKNIE